MNLSLPPRVILLFISANVGFGFQSLHVSLLICTCNRDFLFDILNIFSTVKIKIMLVVVSFFGFNILQATAMLDIQLASYYFFMELRYSIFGFNSKLKKAFLFSQIAP